MTPPPSHLVTFQTDDPDHMMENLAPVASSNVSIQPCKRMPFHAAVQLSQLPQVGLFTVQVTSARAFDPAPLGFCSITVPLGAPFQTVTNGREQTFATGTASVHHWADPFDFYSGDGTEVLVANFDSTLLEDYARKLNGDSEPEPLRFGSSLSLLTPSGASFWRYLSFIWSELRRGGAIDKSELILQELENTLVTMLLYAWQEQAIDTKQRNDGSYPAALRVAEDYILAHLAKPVSVADLAEVSGVSSRSLYKAFHERHGTSPIRFLKARRLEAVQRALLAADPHGTTVTKVAMDYGFFHLGHFSRDYRQAFQELPSETLQR